MFDLRARRSLPALLLAVALAAPACWGDDDGDDEPDPSGCDGSGEDYWPATSAALECQVLVIVNERRAEGADCRTHGLYGPAQPLAMDPQLRRAARLHSQDMGERGYFSHDSPDGPNGDDLVARVATAGFTGWSMLGENIAAGQPTPQAVMDAWMTSDGHCSNVMEPDFNLIGVGHALVTTSDMQQYWTQDFARR